LKRLWKKLSEDGEKQKCGWVIDKYGVSWQIIPTVLGEMLNDSDVNKIQRVMKTIHEMDKLDIEKLRRSYISK
jgi:predicted 3-demethylubiquinone-9 3-methyltransferase (glyoxalase superfamily)